MDRIRKNKKGEISISDLDITMFVILGILVFLTCNLFSSVISYEKGRKQGYKAGYKKCRDADDEYINELVRIIDDLGKGKMGKS